MKTQTQDQYQESIKKFEKTLKKIYGIEFKIGPDAVPSKGPKTTKETIQEAFTKAIKNKVFTFDEDHGFQ